MILLFQQVPHNTLITLLFTLAGKIMVPLNQLEQHTEMQQGGTFQIWPQPHKARLPI
jgi:hypothetical protein